MYKQEHFALDIIQMMTSKSNNMADVFSVDMHSFEMLVRKIKKNKIPQGKYKKWPSFFIDIQQPMQCLNITLRFFFMLLFLKKKKRFFDNFVFVFWGGSMCVRISFDGTGFLGGVWDIKDEPKVKISSCLLRKGEAKRKGGVFFSFFLESCS